MSRSFQRPSPNCSYLPQVTAVWSHGYTLRPWDVYPSWAGLHWEAHIRRNSNSSKIWHAAKLWFRSSGQKRLWSDFWRYVLNIATIIYRNAKLHSHFPVCLLVGIYFFMKTFIHLVKIKIPNCRLIGIVHFTRYINSLDWYFYHFTSFYIN